jgi:hypothetical protein
LRKSPVKSAQNAIFGSFQPSFAQLFVLWGPGALSNSFILHGQMSNVRETAYYEVGRHVNRRNPVIILIVGKALRGETDHPTTVVQAACLDHFCRALVFFSVNIRLDICYKTCEVSPVVHVRTECVNPKAKWVIKVYFLVLVSQKANPMSIDT